MDDEIYNFTQPVTVYEAEPAYSQLVDAKGRPLVYKKEPIGFKLRKYDDC
jgi:hypothetical protein